MINIAIVPKDIKVPNIPKLNNKNNSNIDNKNKRINKDLENENKFLKGVINECI